MKIKLPEKKFFTVAELADRWEVKPSEVQHLLDIGEIRPADKLAALAGKRITKLIAFGQNPFESFPTDDQDTAPPGATHVVWANGINLLIGFHRDDSDVHSVIGYDATLKRGDITEIDIYKELAEGFPLAFETVILLEDVLAAESKYSVQEREESNKEESKAERRKRLVKEECAANGRTVTDSMSIVAEREGVSVSAVSNAIYPRGNRRGR